MGIERATAIWSGQLKDGSGTFNLPKADYMGEYTFSSRFESGDGSNPEELVSAALASCFSMFLSALLSKQSFQPVSIETEVSVQLDTTDQGPEISNVQIKTKVNVPSITEALFQELVDEAKQNCPISKLYAGAPIRCEAVLISD